jgi:ribosomal protein S20
MQIARHIKKQAIRNALFRLGLHTTPKGVVHALAQQGIQVAEVLVKAVFVEILKETTRGRVAKVSRPVPLPAVRRCPKAHGETCRGSRRGRVI